MLWYANFDADYEIEYVDSDECNWVDTDEDEGVTGGRRKQKFPPYNPNSSRVIFVVGMTFEGPDQFKEALARYSIMEKYELKFTKNTKQYVRTRCKKPQCPWYILASKDGKTEVFQVIALSSDHECTVVNKIRKLTHNKLADYLIQKFNTVASIKLINL